MDLVITEITQDQLEECVNLYIRTFEKEPWYDKFQSKQPVIDYFNNFMKMGSFLGYVGLVGDQIVALSVGMKKPWIEGIEYYIDEFCVDYSMQKKGIGSMFLEKIQEQIKGIGMNGMMLNTEEDYPSYQFFTKNGFSKLNGLVVLGK